MLEDTQCLWMLCDLSADYSGIFDTLTTQQKEKHLSFQSATRATEYLLGRWLCSQLIQDKTQDDENGLPFVPESPKLTLNISHCRHGHSLLVAAVVSNAPVGIDCELLSKPRHRDALSKKWFSSSELSWMNAIDDEQARRFCQLWTAKEAHIKQQRSSIAASLSSAVVEIDSAGNMRTPSNKITHHLPNEDVVIAVANSDAQGISFHQADSPT